MGLMAAVVSMSIVPAASAAPVTGSVSDAQDAAIDVSTNLREPDARTVSASYDRETGEFVFTTELWTSLHNTPSRYVNVAAGVNLTGTSCGDGQQQMTVSLSASVWSNYSYSYAALYFDPSSGYRGGLEGQASLSPDGRTLSGRFQAAALVRQNLRCISQIGLSSGDQVSRFCLDGPGCFAPPPTQDTTPPEVAWVTPTNGQVVSGRLRETSPPVCLVNARDSSGIARTENYVDGKFNDQQVFAPWSCEIDTTLLADGPHTLMVRAYDKAGNFADASTTVIVRNSGPAPAPPGAPPAPPAPPVPPTPIPPATPSPPANPSPGTTTKLVTSRQARRAVKSKLAWKYRSFDRAKRPRISCQPNSSQTVQTCVVRWSARGKTYVARARVRHSGFGYVVKVTSLHVRDKRR